MVDDWQHRQHQAPSKPRGCWMFLMLILDLARAIQGGRWCPCPLSWGTPEPPSPKVAGQWCQLWVPPSNPAGRNKGTGPLLPRGRSSLAGWALQRGRAAREWADPMLIPQDIPCHPASAGCLEPSLLQSCGRVSVGWENIVLLAFLLTSQGAPFLCLFCWRILTLLLCE